MFLFVLRRISRFSGDKITDGLSSVNPGANRAVFALAAAVCLLAPAGFAAWRPLGPFGGEAAVIRALPDKKDIVIAATRTGFLFESRNGGASWDHISFPVQTAGVLHALEIDPRSGSVWYAGVEGNIPAVSGVYKTIDSGHTWTLLPGTKGIAVWALAFSPSNPDTMAAGTDAGVWLTSNAGAAWKQISRPGDPELKPVVSLAFDPKDSGTVYAGTTHLPWRTTDVGATWNLIHTGMIDDSDVFSIVIDPAQPQRVFASACSGAYASADAAGHWKRLSTPPGAFRTYFISLDPKHPETVFAGTSDGLVKSVNGGATWKKVSPHAVKSISFDRFVAGRIFFASVDAGLLVSTDNGETLREINTGFTNRAFTSLAGSGTVMYLSGVSEFFRTDNLAMRWTTPGAGPSGEKIMSLAAVDGAPNRLYGAGFRGLFESVDGGKTWQTAKGFPEGVRVTALVARAKGVMLAGTDQGVYRSDAPGRWNLTSPSAIHWVQGAGDRAVSAISATSAMVSVDEGLTWRDCGSPSDGAVWYGLAVSPANPLDALAATSRGLFRSGDGCHSWNPVTSGLEAATTGTVLFHPTRGGEAFVAQGGRVFRSVDGGRNWRLFDEGEGQDFWPSSFLILASAPDRLFALVPGRGVFSAAAVAENSEAQVQN